MASTLVASNNPKYSFLRELGLQEENHGVFNGGWGASGSVVESTAPASDEVIARVRFGNTSDYGRAIDAARQAYDHWADVPAPQRGEIVRQIGDSLRGQLENLGKLVG